MRTFYKITIIATCAIFLLSGCATGYSLRTTSVLKPETGQRVHSKEIQIKTPPKKLTLGEKLTYQVRWLGIPVGTIVASTAPQLGQINGRSAYKVKVVVRTNDFCSKIYKIEDEFVSYIDAETMTTLRHEVYRREGRYRKDAITDFNQQEHMAHFENFLDKSKKTFKISENTQDTLSACYYFRILKLKLDDRIKYFVVNNEQNYELFGVIEDKKFINIKNLGDFESFFIQPYAKVLGGEKVKKGKVSGYFSADEERLPLLAIVEAPMFTKVTATLAGIERID